VRVRFLSLANDLSDSSILLNVHSIPPSHLFSCWNSLDEHLVIERTRSRCEDCVGGRLRRKNEGYRDGDIPVLIGSGNDGQEIGGGKKSPITASMIVPSLKGACALFIFHGADNYIPICVHILHYVLLSII